MPMFGRMERDDVPQPPRPPRAQAGYGDRQGMPPQQRPRMSDTRSMARERMQQGGMPEGEQDSSGLAEFMAMLGNRTRDMMPTQRVPMDMPPAQAAEVMQSRGMPPMPDPESLRERQNMPYRRSGQPNDSNMPMNSGEDPRLMALRRMLGM